MSLIHDIKVQVIYRTNTGKSIAECIISNYIRFLSADQILNVLTARVQSEFGSNCRVVEVHFEDGMVVYEDEDQYGKFAVWHTEKDCAKIFGDKWATGEEISNAVAELARVRSIKVA